MINTINSKVITVAALSLCACLFAGCKDAQAKTNDEIEAEALSLMDRLTSTAGSDLEAFRTCYADDYNEEDLMANFESDWGKYTGKDQHFATVIAAAEPYYWVDITSAICSGSYPNTHSEYADFGWALADTADGLKITSSQEATDRLSEHPDLIYPDGLFTASDCGRNATFFNEPVYWYMNQNHVVNGSLENMLRYVWQDEEGNLCLALLLANGTGGNRSYNSFQLTLTDETLGTVYDGDLMDNIITGSFSLMNGTNSLVICKVPASEVQTGTQVWGQMQYSIHTNHV